MFAVIKHETKTNFKSFLIWTLSVSLMGVCCILLFSSMKDSMADMADTFASMGSFSEAFGMNTLSIATLTGFFATEIGVIHTLGAGMFAAMMATAILSKEEDGHTGEFLYTLPVSRAQAVASKLFVVVLNTFLFTLICGLLYAGSIAVLNEEIDSKKFMLFLVMQFVSATEIACICFAFSAFSKKNQIGLGIGLAIIFYAFDMMTRVIPDLEDLRCVGPFSYSNATQVFTQPEVYWTGLWVGIAVIAVSSAVAFWRYCTRDLAS